MAPLSRAESKERTRGLILDAALTLFLDHGYHACSVEQIADTAGFTTGAVYSNFGGKPDLAAEALDMLYAREIDRILADLAGDDSLGAWQRVLGEWADRMIGERRWARFELEVASVAATADSSAQRYARMRERIARLIGARSEIPDAERVDWDATAMLMLGLMLGVAVQRAADPSLAVTSITHGLGALVRHPPSRD
ncbi:TetR/AcrR family transcriptional regulator [Millisia brevis]|uniref:TetR/AcrR family transcriptional regulator n=1 Tax=Millisia brevis TaxID=264148 RepID=UPI0014713E83|nr:TetR/AcrR family transcriptional regulator [Millisia brevis]